MGGWGQILIDSRIEGKPGEWSQRPILRSVRGHPRSNGVKSLSDSRTEVKLGWWMGSNPDRYWYERETW